MAAIESNMIDVATCAGGGSNDASRPRQLTVSPSSERSAAQQ